MNKNSPEVPLPNLDEISKELEEIEAKYTPKVNRKCPKIPLAVYDNLVVLSKEFDSLGLPCISLDRTLPEILTEVVQISRDLVQKHRNTVNWITDKAVETVTQDNKHKELHLKIADYKLSLERLKETCMALKTTKAMLADEVKVLRQQDKSHKEELLQVKRACATKEQLLEHNIRKLKLEVERLKELCGEDIVKQSTRNDIALKLLHKHKLNEEIYQTTIKTLQDNNRQLLEEVLELKEELILCKNTK